MAKFWKGLKKHKDTVKKHKITDKEIEFLKNIQHEMNTQDHVGQADPRYWVIRDYKREYGKELSAADGISIFDSSNCETILEVDYECFGVDKVIDKVLQEFEKAEYELTEAEIEEIKSAYDLDSLINMLEEVGTYDFEVFQYHEVPCDYGMFLTHQAAIEHLKSNAHHYAADAHTYAHTAWRSKEEMLWKILQSVDWDAMGGSR